ncbi:MAG: DEAD/DEAH box helicase family protein [Bacteroidota bacterium]
MNELLLQEKYLVNFFCERTDGLHYREVKANTVSSDFLMIEEDLKSFLRDTDDNKAAWKKLLRKFGSEDRLMAAFMAFLQDRMQDATNMAIFLNNNQSVTFEGEQVFLFYKSGSQVHGDRLFDQNIFSVVQEMPYKFQWEGKKYFAFRPDVTFFLNGLYFGYSELKSNYNNQSAWKNGIRKVQNNYESAVEAYRKIAENNDKDKNIQKQFLKIFHKAIHVSTTDINDTFVIRNISICLDSIYKPSQKKGETYEDILKKNFKLYPLHLDTKLNGSRTEKFEEVCRALFDKKMIEKEILYYNFIERELVKDEKSKKRYKERNGRLIAPRPKQKFGTDKIVAQIDEFLDHENDPGYFLKKLERVLKELKVGETKRKELIEKRKLYRNNKNVYSLLLQYAAGFGKSNIIGWAALQLKDLQRNGEFVYDKILLVVDRLQLRDQLDSKLFNMNINNKMYVEATDKSTFKNALEGQVRIIVVNLQKFGSAKGFVEPDILQKLADMRVVFLIDEIHRSHAGTQSEEMMSLFDEIQSGFDDSKPYQKAQKKKNLIIGFTATPTDINLQRFGEYNKYHDSDFKIWIPFDSYTMNEAINDGYILNPLTGMVPVAAKMFYEVPNDPAAGTQGDEKEYTIQKKRIYENEERIEAIAKFVVDRLVSAVYPNIRGTAKAMLAVYSIPAAKLYFKHIKKLYSAAAKKKGRFEEAPIFIVFSESQEHGKAKNLNGGKTEKTVLQEFSLKKGNGLIIVVDKLQTGFDEPKLHTLFLDKEIKGINAIQTISRVNRTTKYKEDCKIVDFSYKNVNINNIKKAFEHYSNVVISDIDPLNDRTEMMILYKDLQDHSLFQNNYNNYLTAHSGGKVDVNALLAIQTNFENYIRQNEEAARDLKRSVNRYFSRLHRIEFTVEVEAKYSDENFFQFWRLYNRIYNTLNRTGGNKDEIEIYYDYKTGIVAPPLESGSGGGSGKRGSGGGATGGGRQTNIFEIIEQRNKEEEAIEARIEEFKEKLEALYQYLESPEVGSRLIAKMKDTNNAFTEDEIMTDFERLYKRYVRRNRNDLSDFFKRESKDILPQIYDDFRDRVMGTGAIITKPFPLFEEKLSMAAEDNPVNYSKDNENLNYFPGHMFMGTDDKEKADELYQHFKQFLDDIGFEIINDGELIKGSWIRRNIIGRIKASFRSKEAKELFEKGKKAAEIAHIELKQSEANKNNMEGIAALLKSIENIPEITARFGQFIIVKSMVSGKPKLIVHTLTTNQLILLEKEPDLLNQPLVLLQKLSGEQRNLLN